MAVLVEAISVIIKLDAIKEKYPGEWDAFPRIALNGTLCADDQLVRVGFMIPADADSFIQELEQLGFVYVRDEKVIDLCVDYEHGQRAAVFAQSLARSEFKLAPSDLADHLTACRAHSDGLRQGNITVLSARIPGIRREFSERFSSLWCGW